MTAAASTDENDQLRIDRPSEGKSESRVLADVKVDPVAHAAATVRLFAKGTFGDLGIGDSFDALKDATDKVRGGDMAGPETMLVAQAASLNAIFTELARRSAANMGEYIKASETYMRLALKAQAQCRATVETLAAIKNPPIVFARQANIATGPQQVNNHATPPRASETACVPNGLLETDHGKRLDSGTAGAAIGGDPALETVGARHRAGNSVGEGAGKPQRLQRRDARRAA